MEKTAQERQEMADSIKYGFCKAISESGFSPSEVEELLKTGAVNPLAVLQGAGGVVGPITVGTVGLGALAGVGTAMLRNKLDHMAAGTEDEKMKKTRMKVEMYKKMINDLKTDESSQVPA